MDTWPSPNLWWRFRCFFFSFLVYKDRPDWLHGRSLNSTAWRLRVYVMWGVISLCHLASYATWTKVQWTLAGGVSFYWQVKHWWGPSSSSDRYNGKSINQSDDRLQRSSISPSFLATRASITVNFYATIRYPATAFPVGFEAQIDEIHLTCHLLHG